MAALALTAATLTACSNEEEAIVEENAQQDRVVTLVTTLSPMSGVTTRTTATETSGALALRWEVDDKVWVSYTNTSGTSVEAQGTVTAVDGSGNATISVDLTNPKNGNSTIVFGFPYIRFHNSLDPRTGQIGTLADIVANYAASRGDGTLSVSGGTATLPTGVTMNPQMCIWKLSFTDGTNSITSSITSLTVSLGTDDYVITPSSLSNIYVAFYGSSSPRSVSIKAITTPSNLYIKAKSGITLDAGKMYTTSNLALVQAELGKLIAADGNIYNNVAAATAAGTTASGIIAYLGTAGSVDASSSTYMGLAISLTDAGNCAWYTEDSGPCLSQINDITTALSHKDGIANTNTLTSDGHTHAAATAARNYSTARPSGVSAWFLPSVGQWNLICQGLATKKAGTTVSTDLNFGKNANYGYGNLSDVITAAGGTELAYGYYWLNTEFDNINAWIYHGLEGKASYNNKHWGYYVRPVFAF